MGRRKRLCITSTDIPIESEIHDQSSEFSATDIPTKGDQSGHPQTTEGGQSTTEEHSSIEGGESVRDEGNELVQYLWTLMRIASHVGIDYDDWRKISIEKKRDMYYMVKHGEKWRTWKGALKARAYDSSLTIDQIVAQQTEKDNKALKNGVYPTRGQINVKTHTRKNGNIVNEKVAQVMTFLQAIASDSSNTQGSSTLGSIDDFSNDGYSIFKGPKKRGYIRCVGRMPTIKKKVVSCSNDLSVEQLKTMVNVMANIIQEHTPNANLYGILSNMNIQMPGNTSTIPRNSNSVNQRASFESHHNDGNC
uniref:Uncharacterized protein n=1 Tax=Lactuca sativa TaxID=4236 RepID=A0A9R1VNE8_LACSA|nr:hypothetical protein LSAT_V11C500268150 [Lactuca sativa]